MIASIHMSEEATVYREYNYPTFLGEEDCDGFMGRPHVGERAPDGTLSDLEGRTVALSDLWRQSHLMLEFGSYT
jgi:hypothetical protein